MLEFAGRTGDASAMFTGTTNKHFPQERRGALLMPVPDLHEQQRVVARLRDVDKHARRLRRELCQLEARSIALRRASLDAPLSGRPTGRSLDSEIVEALAGQHESPLVAAGS
jgi:hypothetical protein